MSNALTTSLLRNKAVKPAIAAATEAFNNATGGALKLRDRALELGGVIAGTKVWTKAVADNNTIVTDDAIEEVLAVVVDNSETDGESNRVMKINMRTAIVAGTFGMTVAALDDTVTVGKAQFDAAPADFKPWHKGDFVRGLLVATKTHGQIPDAKAITIALGKPKPATTSTTSTGPKPGKETKPGAKGANGGVAPSNGGTATDQAPSGDVAPATDADMVPMTGDAIASAFSKFLANASESDARNLFNTMGKLLSTRFPAKGKDDNVTKLEQPGIKSRKAG